MLYENVMVMGGIIKVIFNRYDEVKEQMTMSASETTRLTFLVQGIASSMCHHNVLSVMSVPDIIYY